ncbi:hypothetical protein PR001_g25663 [Phytophthora rubi]|uniref:Uncharacterized protein n=1 Tax=Phytophthora rubi TaxID=129364 RepID=A0A6A3I5R9_9STRA|nr:hypothetical protein PR001_g25663 [Phytophthora rubi]
MGVYPQLRADPPTYGCPNHSDLRTGPGTRTSDEIHMGGFGYPGPSAGRSGGAGERRERGGKRGASIRPPVLSLAGPDPGKKAENGRGGAHGGQQRLSRGAAQSLEEVAKRRREVTRKAAAKTVGEQQRRVVVETGDGDVRSVRRVRGDRPVQGTGDGAARGEARATSQPAKPDEERGGAKPHAPVAGRKTAVDGDDATRRVVIDLACASVVQTKEEQAEVVAQQLDAWMTQFGADVAPDEVVGSTKKRDEEDEGGSPESVQQAMATETGRRDPAKAKVLRVKAAEVLQRAAQAEVEARQLHRYQKRKLREHERRERRAARASRESEQVVEVVRAAVVPDKGHDELVVEAAMLVTSTGPVVTPSSDEFVRVSRTRRRYEKLARKARAREDRKLREWLATQ